MVGLNTSGQMGSDMPISMGPWYSWLTLLLCKQRSRVRSPLAPHKSLFRLTGFYRHRFVPVTKQNESNSFLAHLEVAFARHAKGHRFDPDRNYITWSFSSVWLRAPSLQGGCRWFESSNDHNNFKSRFVAG